jgi:hypothetical protein
MSDIHTEEEIADTYLRHFELRQAQDFWAFEEVHGLFERGELEAAWRMTRLLIKKASSDEALAYVAAGPLEDLLYGPGLAIVEWVETAARSDERLQLALSGVWLDREDPVYERWYALMDEFGFTYGRRTPL